MKDTLRFITCGSVDDGKLTLIGRLLWESKQVFDDHLSEMQKDSTRYGTQGDAMNLARARAKHNHRRCLSLLRHATTAIRGRGCARPRAIRAQHGNRSIYLRVSCPRCQCRQGSAGANPSARQNRGFARHPAFGDGGEQNGSCRLG